jgi:hypothetical protein
MEQNDPVARFVGLDRLPSSETNAAQPSLTSHPLQTCPEFILG